MTVNLSDYVGKFVTITLHNGSTEVGTVEQDSWLDYPFQFLINDQDYTNEGKWNGDKEGPMDILKIEEYVPPTERYCESCALWEEGYCQLPNIIQHSNDATMEIVVRVDDDSGLWSTLKTGPKFGCNQHKGVWE
jgi:hypothetical protein